MNSSASAANFKIVDIAEHYESLIQKIIRKKVVLKCHKTYLKFMMDVQTFGNGTKSRS
jgi:hypothetical protein